MIRSVPFPRPVSLALRPLLRYSQPELVAGTRGYASVMKTLPLSTSASAPAATGEEVPLRLQAIKLYKELHRLGRDYPDPAYDFNKRLRRAFEKNAKITDPAHLKKQLELGEHIKKEVLALISLKKFRHLRRTYHANEGPR